MRELGPVRTLKETPRILPNRRERRKLEAGMREDAEALVDRALIGADRIAQRE